MFIIFMVFSSLKRPHQTVFRVAHLQTSVLNWKKILHNVDSEDLVLEVRGAYHSIPDHASSYPREMLDYIDKEQFLDLHGKLSMFLHLLLTLLVTVVSG